MLVIDFLTLVSNFGGSLGLFVGFSFVMLWDVVQFFITLSCQKMTSKGLRVMAFSIADMSLEQFDDLRQRTSDFSDANTVNYLEQN